MLPFAWMLSDDRTRQKRAGRFFATVARAEALGHGAVEVACLDGAIVGGAIWLPPGRWIPTLAEVSSRPSRWRCPTALL